jgi:hypothetical protein
MKLDLRRIFMQRIDLFAAKYYYYFFRLFLKR